MSLRNSLRRATELRVARVNERNSQLSGVAGATATATAAQQQPAKPHEYRVSSATGNATAAQQGVLNDRNFPYEPTELRVARAYERNSQLGGLTAHRLAASINRCCAARGDSEANRAGLIAECLALPADQQRDLIDHFTGEAAANACHYEFQPPPPACGTT